LSLRLGNAKASANNAKRDGYGITHD